MAWNEVSRRYVDDEPEFWFPKEWRGRPVNTKQGSDGVIGTKDLGNGLAWSPDKEVIPMIEDALLTYTILLKEGVAPEQARMILPQNTMTEWIWSGSLMAFARVCKLRLDAHAQQETQEIAKKINDLIPVQFEHSWRALLGES